MDHKVAVYGGLLFAGSAPTCAAWALLGYFAPSWAAALLTSLYACFTGLGFVLLCAALVARWRARRVLRRMQHAQARQRSAARVGVGMGYRPHG